jgi:hypothetical protein
VAVPEEAMRRRRELTQGAWHLYETYCRYRNRDTGRCDPGLETLAREMQRTYTHVSNMKSELVDQGWLRRVGRHAVDLLVGQFAPPKISPLVRNNPNEEGVLVRKNPNEENPSLGKILTAVRKNPNEEIASPITAEPVVEPVAAAAATAPRDWRSEICDERWIEQVKSEGDFSTQLVDFVWRKLQRNCEREGVEPTKGRFDHWLSTERGTPPVQPTLPAMGADLVAGNFEPGTNQRVQAPDPECTRCFGAGMEVVPGRGARRCQCRSVEVEQPTNEEIESVIADDREQKKETG